MDLKRNATSSRPTPKRLTCTHGVLSVGEERGGERKRRKTVKVRQPSSTRLCACLRARVSCLGLPVARYTLVQSLHVRDALWNVRVCVRFAFLSSSHTKKKKWGEQRIFHEHHSFVEVCCVLPSCSLAASCGPVEDTCELGQVIIFLTL